MEYEQLKNDIPTRMYSVIFETRHWQNGKKNTIIMTTRMRIRKKNTFQRISNKARKSHNKTIVLDDQFSKRIPCTNNRNKRYLGIFCCLRYSSPPSTKRVSANNERKGGHWKSAQQRRTKLEKKMRKKWKQRIKRFSSVLSWIVLPLFVFSLQFSVENKKQSKQNTENSNRQ